MIKSPGAEKRAENLMPALEPKPSRAEDRRNAILDCADAVFVTEGYQGASMAAIAQRVGGSKATLYNYFPSKEDLFAACVARRCERLHAQVSSLLAEGRNVEETLRRVGARYVAMLSSDEFVQPYRMVIAEAGRAPEVGVAFYENGPARGATVLAAYIARAMEEGALRRDDPAHAAEHFIALCHHRFSKIRLCNVAPAPSEAEIAQEVERAVRVFMAAYAAKA
ncbi:MAG: TetR/AcrR family transcriptional regulator [Hyphomonadaceae bacterium]